MMSKKNIDYTDERYWYDDEEVYTRESTQDSRKQKEWNERPGSYGKGGKKEYIRSLRKNKRSKRSDVWGQ